MTNGKFDIYEVITNKIIQSLEAGKLPWLKPWDAIHCKTATRGELPYNGFSGRNYNGMNQILLGLMPYNSNAYYSYKQVTELGGTVRKGEKATMVVFWTFTEYKDQVTGEQAKIPFLRYYNVFNYEQCDNLPEPKHVIADPIKYDSLDSLVKDDLNIKLAHGGNSAFYSPALDAIQMPRHEAFISETFYKGTLLHELTHATGHSTRCNRDFKNRFGSEAYAFEELVAELGSAFLGASLNVEPVLQHNANYIANWLVVLKNDKKAIITASSQAQKACKWVLDSLSLEDNTEELDQAA